MRRKPEVTFTYLSAVILFAILVQAGFVFADESNKCSAAVKEIKMESTQATAGFLANEGNKPGSIRYESGAILEKADSGLSSAEKPAGLCPAGCVLPAKPVIVFRAVPTAFVTNYSDYDKCQKLLEETEKTPFEYNESFSSMSEVESWFSDFSRGKGTDGQDLYKRCSGQCSPQYEFFITNDAGKLALDADVVCGHARDKSNNMYDISYSYKWICQSK
jgi:hypothetical protein